MLAFFTTWSIAHICMWRSAVRQWSTRQWSQAVSAGPWPLSCSRLSFHITPLSRPPDHCQRSGKELDCSSAFTVQAPIFWTSWITERLSACGSHICCDAVIREADSNQPEICSPALIGSSPIRISRERINRRNRSHFTMLSLTLMSKIRMRDYQLSKNCIIPFARLSRQRFEVILQRFEAIRTFSNIFPPFTPFGSEPQLISFQYLDKNDHFPSQLVENLRC